MKILLVGASSTGKTTILNMMDSKYNKITEVVRRLVKDKGIDINEHGSIETQKLIFDTYVNELSNNDNYVSDRCLIDVLGYTTTNYTRMDETDPLKNDMLTELGREYDAMFEWFAENKDVKIIYFPIEFDSVDDGVRSTDEQYRKETDENMKLLVGCVKEVLGYDYLTVHGTPEERLKQINEYIDE